MSANRADILAKANTPIAFYVLALLVVEGFIGLVVGVADFSPARKFTCLLIGVGLFLLTVVVVTIFAWQKPHILLYGEKSHLRERMGTPPPEFGTDEKSVSEEEVDELESVEQTAE